MKVYDKSEVDIVFSSWESDLKELSVINAIPVSVIADIKTEIEQEILESLSDRGEEWFVAEKVNECLAIIDRHINGKENE